MFVKLFVEFIYRIIPQFDFYVSHTNLLVFRFECDCVTANGTSLLNGKNVKTCQVFVYCKIKYMLSDIVNCHFRI